MSDDIVKWLRFHIWTDEPTALDRAADEIERLRADLANWQRSCSAWYAGKLEEDIRKLREALEPFAYYADAIDPDVSNLAGGSGTVGDLRRARAVLEETGGGDE